MPWTYNLSRMASHGCVAVGRPILKGTVAGTVPELVVQ
jgi:hypothetical protein